MTLTPVTTPWLRRCWPAMPPVIGAATVLPTGRSRWLLDQDATCTITNDDISPTITVIKTVINDDGGTAAPDDFNLTVDGGAVLSGATNDFDAGDHTVAETLLAGYAAGDWGGDCAADGSVTLALDQDATCTITNDDISPTITVIKTVINDNGGTAAPDDFNLTVDGGAVLSGATNDFDAGDHTVAETLLAGYAAGDWGGDCAADGSVTLALDQDATCTITNNDNAPSLTLVKEVINDNGGTAVAGDWALTAAGYDPVSPDAGTYDLSETGPADYTLTSLTCDNAAGQVSSVTLGLGESVTCTFVNDDDAPSLTLVKEVINDNGGTAVAGDWALTAAGYDPVSPDAGTYDLSETGPADYTLTSLTCDNAAGQVSSVTLGLGESVTCTFVNDDDAPSLTLVKEVINDNGGTAVAGDWALTAAGYDPVSPDAGTYDLSETGPADYTLTSLTCDNAAGQVSSVTLGLGESVTCTFVNDDDAPSLTLVKEVINDNGGTAVAGDWALTAAGYDPVSPDAGTYDLSETGPADYTLTSLTCDNAAGQVSSVTLGLGESVTCTFVNDDDAPSLTLVKEVNNGANPGGTAVPGDWTLTATGPTGFSGQTVVTSDAGFDAGSYDLSEAGPAGYLASDWVCVGGGNQTDADTISLGLGDEATCTITNTAMGMTTLLKLTDGVESQTAIWNFTLTGPAVDKSDSTPPTTVDFGGVKLIPGEEYTLCETGIPAGWTSEWQVDTDGDGVPDTIIPVVTGVNNSPVGPDGYSNVYDPNYVPPPGQFTNDTRCVNFVVDVGETLAFQINNAFPGGDPRTIGYWKNWNTCTGGNQPATAAANGGPAEGWYILDDLLNSPGYTIGILPLGGEQCEDAVNILDKRDVESGKKNASDAAYGLAAQLLAAQLNLSAGAETCQAAVDAVNAGQTLLADIDFDGTRNYLKGKNAGALRAEANGLAATLDAYNNGLLCSP